MPRRRRSGQLNFALIIVLLFILFVAVYVFAPQSIPLEIRRFVDPIAKQLEGLARQVPVLSRPGAPAAPPAK
jgi:hypothetical protein